MHAKWSTELREKGFAILGRCLPRAAFEEIRDEVIRLDGEAKLIAEQAVESKEPSRLWQGTLVVVPEATDPRKVCRYEHIVAASPVIAQVLQQELLPILSLLDQAHHVPFKDKVNVKNPGGGAFGPHQDFAAYKHFQPRHHLTAMIAIDRMTQANGCLNFSANAKDVAKIRPAEVLSYVSDFPFFRSHIEGSRHGEIVDAVSSTLEWQPVELTPGEIVVFNSLVPHHSKVNTSREQRRALFITSNRISEGDWYKYYYQQKRERFHDPMFHVATPTEREEL